MDSDRAPIFETGKPVPRVWLHMEFDFSDTMHYLGGECIPSDEERDRLVDKYLGGDNSYDNG